MAKVTKDNAANPYGVDDGQYTATITSIERRTGKGGRDFFSWDFKVDEPVRESELVDEEVTLRGTTPTGLKDKNILDTWLRNLGIDTEDGDTVELDDLVGARVQILVLNKETKDGKSYCNVIKATKLRRSKPKDEDQDERPPKKPVETRRAAKPRREEPEDEEPPRRPRRTEPEEGEEPLRKPRRAEPEDDEPKFRRARPEPEDEDPPRKPGRRAPEEDPDDRPPPRRRAAAADDRPTRRRPAEEDADDGLFDGFDG